MKSVVKSTVGHESSFGMKMTLKKYSPEKYGETACSLERAGPLPQDAGEEMGMEVENEQAEG